MPILNSALSEASPQSASTKSLIAELHSELIMEGHVIDTSEVTSSKFGPTTVAAVKADQARLGFGEDGVVSPLLGRISRVARMVVRGSMTDLGPALTELAAMAANAPAAAQTEIARYAVILGDYALARSIAARMPNDAGMAGLMAITGTVTAPPKAMDLSQPENYYSYRLQPFGNDTDAIIKELQDSAIEHRLFRRRIKQDQESEDTGERDLPPPEEPIPPPAEQEIAIGEPFGSSVKQAAVGAIKAIAQWQAGNADFKNQKYKQAVLAYSSCDIFAREYFKKRYDITFASRVRPMLAVAPDHGGFLGTYLAARRASLSLASLKKLDWQSTQPLQAKAILERDLRGMEINPSVQNGMAKRAAARAVREASWDRILFLMITVFVPMARAEANRMLRQYDAAIADLNKALITSFLPTQTITNPETGQTPFPSPRPVFCLCEFIEVPFIRIVLAETMLEKAEAQYKSREPISAAQPESLAASQTYEAVLALFGNDSGYITNVNAGLTALQKRIDTHLAPPNNAEADVSSTAFRAAGREVYLPAVTPSGGRLAGTSKNLAPHSSFLAFDPAMPGRAANPKIYAILLACQARLAQIAAGFNYLGYTDDYTPPWRFQFLLDRTRYFAEHAKNAQRDYLNFLSNAEQEEFQELSASQAVELEKSNVRIEGARVDQVRLEVAASVASKDLAGLSAQNALTRISNFREFDKEADALFGTSTPDLIAGIASVLDAVPGLNAVATGVGDFFTGGFFTGRKHAVLADMQRAFELQNLLLASKETAKAAVVATANLNVAEAGLIVAGLQHQASLLRHEFAVQNLLFLRSRTLNTEQWYRLAASIRSIADTYLRYAIELGFLTEQAYEFEADKQINVMRFDYDQSEVGNFLAADFLLRDLDTLEQDLMVSQKQRQQQVKYTVSMARDFPMALQELRDNGSVTFALPLEQIERRFPGLFNARIGAVDVMPVALLDASRFSMELTHMGSGVVRRRAQPGDAVDPLSANPTPADQELATEWKRLIRVNGPETTIYSGLSRQEAGSVFPFITNGQRNAFEGRPAASAWQVDMSMKDNQVVPGTLADMLFTFTLSGYQDCGLRKLVEQTFPKTNVVTSYLSARQAFPDAYYDFHRTGKMVWAVTPDRLALNGEAGRLRNIGVILLPAVDRIHFGRLNSRFGVDIRINGDGTLEILSEIPEVTITVAAPNTVSVSAIVAPGADLSWDFGDGGRFRGGASIDNHVYAKPGIYVVTLRIVRNGRLSEFCADVSVSRAQELVGPETAFPVLTKAAGASKLRVATAAPSALWSVGKLPVQRGQQAEFDLGPGEYTLNFMTQRVLKARLFCNQRQPNGLLEMPTSTLTTNRKFDDKGTDVTGGDANPLTQHLFANPSGEISPADTWTLEVNATDNPFLNASTGADVIAPNFAALQDVVMVVESEVKLGQPLSPASL